MKTRLIPAIDIIGGECVRLSQGDFARSKSYKTTPLEMALLYSSHGVERLHLVDLDGAKSGTPQNLQALREITSRTSLSVEWGGGVRSMETVKSVLDAGASSVICGSLAVEKPELFREFLRTFGPERIILGADISGGKIATRGWLEVTDFSINTLIEAFLPDGLSQVICTDISKDGMLLGPSFELYEGLMARYPGISFTVSGGVRSMEDMERLTGIGAHSAVVGKAIFEGRITLEEIERWQQRG